MWLSILIIVGSTSLIYAALLSWALQRYRKELEKVDKFMGDIEAEYSRFITDRKAVSDEKLMNLWENIRLCIAHAVHRRYDKRTEKGTPEKKMYNAMFEPPGSTFLDYLHVIQEEAKFRRLVINPLA